MELIIEHAWQVSVKEARAIQLQLTEKIILQKYTGKIGRICAVDVSYGRFDHAGYAVLGWFSVAPDSHTGRFSCRLERTFTAIAEVGFPYIPGYLSFREIPVLLPLFRQLPEKPDLLLVDGAGIAHARGIGLAAHLGVIFDVPAIGCAKSYLFGDYSEPGNEFGATAAITHNYEVIGYVLRSKKNTNPLFVSPGHRTESRSAVDIIKKFCGMYRIPEPLRSVDLISKNLRRNPGQYSKNNSINIS